MPATGLVRAERWDTICGIQKILDFLMFQKKKRLIEQKQHDTTICRFNSTQYHCKLHAIASCFTSLRPVSLFALLLGAWCVAGCHAGGRVAGAVGMATDGLLTSSRLRLTVVITHGRPFRPAGPGPLYQDDKLVASQHSQCTPRRHELSGNRFAALLRTGLPGYSVFGCRLDRLQLRT
jgi:hypothetical protein